MGRLRSGRPRSSAMPPLDRSGRAGRGRRTGRGRSSGSSRSRGLCSRPCRVTSRATPRTWARGRRRGSRPLGSGGAGSRVPSEVVGTPSPGRSPCLRRRRSAQVIGVASPRFGAESCAVAAQRRRGRIRHGHHSSSLIRPAFAAATSASAAAISAERMASPVSGSSVGGTVASSGLADGAAAPK